LNDTIVPDTPPSDTAHRSISLSFMCDGTKLSISIIGVAEQRELETLAIAGNEGYSFRRLGEIVADRYGITMIPAARPFARYGIPIP
jgi:hypothetical protein